MEKIPTKEYLSGMASGITPRFSSLMELVGGGEYYLLLYVIYFFYISSKITESCLHTNSA